MGKSLRLAGGVAWCWVAVWAGRTARADFVLDLGQTAVGGVNTGVGFLDVTLNPGLSSGVEYLNVVSNLYHPTPTDWLVQNLAIPLQPGEFGPNSGTFSPTYALMGP